MARASEAAIQREEDVVHNTRVTLISEIGVINYAHLQQRIASLHTVRTL